MRVMTISGDEVKFDGQWIPVRADKPIAPRPRVVPSRDSFQTRSEWIIAEQKCRSTWRDEMLTCDAEGRIRPLIYTPGGHWRWRGARTGDFVREDDFYPVDPDNLTPQANHLYAWMPMPDYVESKEGWISCEDKLPPEDTRVLLYYTCDEADNFVDYVDIVTRSGDRWFEYNDVEYGPGDAELRILEDEDDDFYKKVAWMPLPKPYYFATRKKRRTAEIIAKRLISHGGIKSPQVIARCTGVSLKVVLELMADMK